jgi:hypothetical protein
MPRARAAELGQHEVAHGGDARSVEKCHFTCAGRSASVVALLLECARCSGDAKETEEGTSSGSKGFQGVRTCLRVSGALVRRVACTRNCSQCRGLSSTEPRRGIGHGLEVLTQLSRTSRSSALKIMSLGVGVVVELLFFRLQRPGCRHFIPRPRRPPNRRSARYVSTYTRRGHDPLDGDAWLRDARPRPCPRLPSPPQVPTAVDGGQPQPQPRDNDDERRERGAPRLGPRGRGAAARHARRHRRRRRRRREGLLLGQGYPCTLAAYSPLALHASPSSAQLGCLLTVYQSTSVPVHARHILLPGQTRPSSHLDLTVCPQCTGALAHTRRILLPGLATISCVAQLDNGQASHSCGTS